MSSTVFTQALPLDAKESAAPEHDEMTLLDTAAGATCDPQSIFAGPVRGVPFAADPGAALSVTALEIHFVAETEQDWEDVRVQVRFMDGPGPGVSALAALPPRQIREVSLGARRFSTRSAQRETIRFGLPVTLAAASLRTVEFSLQGRLNGIWMDTVAFRPCLRPEGLGVPVPSGATQDATAADAVMMLTVFGAWLTPPPTLPPIPKPTDTPTPAPPFSARAFVPVAQRSAGAQAAHRLP